MAMTSGATRRLKPILRPKKPATRSSHPSWRARSLSVYRFWRDLGYAIGAVSAGLVADFFGLSWAIASTGLLSVLSGLAVAVLMPERHR
ncbi:MAG: hypothetical protein WBX25_10495 [Rhodomicrobium sp.]